MKLLLGLTYIGMAILTASCNSSPPGYPKHLTDGCYYSGGKAVFKIKGAEGRVLIPGEVRTFKVKSGGDSFHAWVTFTPGILFDASPPTRVLVEAADTPSNPSTDGTEFRTAPITFDMTPGTSVPTIAMHLAAYGDTEVSLGKPC